MPRIVLANLRDIVKVLIGVMQSLWLLHRFKPDVVFAKGGFVCLPVGIAAHLMRVPIVVHDSDTRPGLTNSVLGRWAAAIATGSPLENYRYKSGISRYVGVPIAEAFRPYSSADQKRAKAALGFDPERPLVVVTGGGLGAVTINTALLTDAMRLCDDGVQLYHVTGRAHYDEIMMLAPKRDDYKLVPFVYEGMAEVLGAADVVVSRASATFIQELAGLKKAAILVPSHALGDQRKNAEVYREANAALVLSDDELTQQAAFYKAIMSLINSPERAEQLARSLHNFARPHAARDVAAIVMAVASSGKSPVTE